MCRVRYWSCHVTRGVFWGGLWGPRPPGVTKGAPKRKKKGKGKKERREKRGKKRKRREEREQERKKKERKLNQYDERGTMQFQVQARAPGKKTSGCQIDGEKDERGAMQF